MVWFRPKRQLEKPLHSLSALALLPEKKEDSSMEFASLARTFEELERTSSRLALIELLTELFRSIERLEEIEHVCYLVQGRVAPFF
jgi:hypothetical protein